jgi:ATP-binding cassette subfamily B protein
VNVIDPTFGRISYSQDDFLEGWVSDFSRKEGIVLLMEPSQLSALNGRKHVETKNTLLIKRYFVFVSKHSRSFVFSAVSLLLGMIFQLAIPIVTKNSIDIGLHNWNLSVVLMLFLAQLTLLLGFLITSYVSGMQLLFLSTSINLSVLYVFFSRLFKLPISFIENRKGSDLLLRVSDNSKIESFFSKILLSGAFSIFTFLFFVGLMATYSITFACLYLLFSILFIAWNIKFSKKVTEVDFISFETFRESQSHTLQSIYGFKDIKIFEFEKFMMERWGKLQSKSFGYSFRRLQFLQFQNLGSSFLLELLGITFVIFSLYKYFEGQMTLGMVFSLQYIIGQLNVPLTQFSDVISGVRTAKLGFERLDDIYKQKNENGSDTPSEILDFCEEDSIQFFNVGFAYPGCQTYVIDSMSIKFDGGKVSAIVGESGSGKSSVFKLMLRYFEVSSGQIFMFNIAYDYLSTSDIRKNISVVMQDGFIFERSIRENIIMGFDFDEIRYQKVLDVCNLIGTIDSLPARDLTLIGSEIGLLSSGQKQRVILARCLYKKARIYLLDEATNFLDTVNESDIMSKIKSFLQGKTLIIIAHRLSTVKDADEIFVIDNGKVVERGSHGELIQNRSYYHKLVRNQLSVEDDEQGNII